ncbi:hypothetical protein KC345_g11552, partial [Hortaea werneckii]
MSDRLTIGQLYPASVPPSVLQRQQSVKSSVNSEASFESVLQKNMLKFSNHAAKRLEQRGIELGSRQLDQISNAVDKAAAKGSKESLILLKDMALITKLDVIGNNIANVNTIGFKSGRVMFKDIMSQTVSGVTAPVDGGQGGVNAKQIGLGVSIGSVDTMHLAGSAMTTNNPTDLRIDGDGFFLVKLTGDQETPFLTRAGDFHVDSSRNLITSDGLHVLSSDGEPIQLGEDVTAFSISNDGTIVQTMADGTTEPGVQIAVAK